MKTLKILTRKTVFYSIQYKNLLTLFFMGVGGADSALPCKLFFYHIILNNPINLIFSDFKFYRFINILAKFRCSRTGQFGARIFLSKHFSKFFVLLSLKVFLFFNCLYLGLYCLKVLCTQFFRYLFRD